MKWALAAVLASLTVATTASAQTAVPLTRELLNDHWVVIELNGKQPTSDPATISFANELAEGTTQCRHTWTARYQITLPGVAIHDVQAPAYNCPSAAEVTEFLITLESVKRAKTSPDGLELLDARGKRLMLLNSGG